MIICQHSNDPVIINGKKGWKSSMYFCLSPSYGLMASRYIQIFSSSTDSVKSTRATQVWVNTPASPSLWREETAPDFCRTSKTGRLLGKQKVSRALLRFSTKPHWKISKKTTKAKSVLTRRLFPGDRSWKFPRQPPTSWVDCPFQKLRFFAATLSMISQTVPDLSMFTLGINKWVLSTRSLIV